MDFGKIGQINMKAAIIIVVVAVVILIVSLFHSFGSGSTNAPIPMPGKVNMTPAPKTNSNIPMPGQVHLPGAPVAR